ncbi:MAG: hypothetical protein ABIO46_14155 [Chitinophagales bacterium]
MLLEFKKALSPSAISFSGIPLSFSSDVMKQLVLHWQQQLKNKQASLRVSGIMSEIRPFDHSTNDYLNALYVNEKLVLWPGTAITLRDAKIMDDAVVMFVSDISYPFISALNNVALRKSLGMESMSPLRPPLAICTYSITSDNYIVLTVRGNTTNVYPGRLYGQGGNPTTTSVDIVQHQVEEMQDELLLEPGEIFTGTFRFFGIVEDLESFPGKPDLIGTVQLKFSSKELLERFETRPPENRPPDVADIRLVSFDREGLHHLLLEETKALDYCPPAHGGLLLLARREFGN